MFSQINCYQKGLMILALCSCLIAGHAHASSKPELDVISYSLLLEPNIERGFVEGEETIEFQISPEAVSITLSCGNLEIDTVMGQYVTGFKKSGKQLNVQLATGREVSNQIKIKYHGSPKNGLHFIPTTGRAYTVYATSQWMVCNDAPSDRARFNLDLLVSNEKTCIGNGELIAKRPVQGKTLYSWQQDYQAPAYTYGFVIGAYNSFEQQSEGILFNYWGADHSAGELKKIFTTTPDMLRFFEDKSGVKYYQSSYTQALIGDYYQEMSGFSVLKESYGAHILKDSTAINLISHEFAHQWWGNQITCKSWNHFWLNEAFATFMSAAYNEHRFGRQKYEEDINSYYQVYSKIKEEGKDKSLVFKDWSNPSKSDRNIVYFKGAYVLHLLRQELGDAVFWEGIKTYSTKYFGESVVTKNFQQAMEASAGKSLNAFFTQWVY